MKISIKKSMVLICVICALIYFYSIIGYNFIFISVFVFFISFLIKSFLPGYSKYNILFITLTFFSIFVSASIDIYFLNPLGQTLIGFLQIFFLPIIIAFCFADKNFKFKTITACFIIIMHLSIHKEHWPLRIAFFASSSQLEDIATKIIGNEPPKFPCSAGLFLIRGFATNKSCVVLLTDLDPSGRSGFAKFYDLANKKNKLLKNLNYNLLMKNNWYYQNED